MASFRKKGGLKKLALLASVLLGIGLVGIGSVFAWVSRDLPDPNKLIDRSLAESTKIFARDGTTLLYEIHGDQRRTVVPLDQIPMHVRNATIVAEDQGFYGHHGFSIRGMMRAMVINTLKGGTVQGGSTITQQFIKNSILTSERTYTRKVKELILAYQLENKFTKDQILQLYLNEIPYGSTAYGVESASWIYFGKGVKDATLAEAAILAALPKAPSDLSPFGGNTDRLFSRQNFILDEMTNANVISKEEADAAKAQEIKFQSRIEKIIAPHFVFYVRKLLAEKFSEKTVEQGGLKVVTTLDVDKQRFAEEAIAAQEAKNATTYGASNAALVSLDTKTGQILAMVGSKDYFNDDIDGKVNVTLRLRQPGSSFKPIAYLTAFNQGYTPDTILFDVETDFATGGKPYHPRNYDGREHGPLPMRKALAGSLNIPAVKTLYLSGLSRVLDMADALGYTTLRDRKRYGLSLVLGGGDVTLLEHTNTYATFSREGVRHPSAAFLRIEDRNGKVLEEYQKAEERVVKKEIVQQLNSVLTDNESRSFIFGSRNHLTLPDRPVAAKTGTTNDYHDAWTMGFTPSIATGVWVGNNDNSEMKRGADGSIVAAPIWNAYMRKATAGSPVEGFSPPPKIEVDKPVLRGEIGAETERLVDQETGKLIPASCQSLIPQKYQTTVKVKEVHTILFDVDRNNPRGPAPSDPKSDPQFANWEAGVQRWAGANGYGTSSLTELDCDSRNPDLDPIVTILSPKSGEVTTTQTLKIAFKTKTATGRTLAKVLAVIDGNTIDTITSKPWIVDFTPATLTSGTHALTIRAIDSAGSFNETSVSFTFENKSRRSLILTPSDGSTLTASQFPFLGTVFISNYRTTSTVSVIRRRSGNERRIASIADLKSENGTFTWEAEDAGDVELFLRMIADDKIVTETAPITVTISAE